MKDLTFLYVEDDPRSREALDILMKRVMKLEHVYLFEDSADFLSRVDALPKKPDVFMLDIHMEPHTGLDLIAMLRADTRYQDATIIALTASVMNEEVELLKTSGFDGVIGKPIMVGTFPNLLERLTAGEKIWHITD